jgi:transposase-like protein
MTKEDRASYWQKLVQEQAESGDNGAAFCKDHQINPQRFYFWRRRFKGESHASKGTRAFLELVPSSKIQGSGIRIRLDERLWIELESYFDSRTLRKAIDALCGQGSCWR